MQHIAWQQNRAQSCTGAGVLWLLCHNSGSLIAALAARILEDRACIKVP